MSPKVKVRCRRCKGRRPLWRRLWPCAECGGAGFIECDVVHRPDLIADGVPDPKTRLKPAELVFAEEWARLDREDPGWDRDGKLAAAEALWKAGAPLFALEAAYGVEMMDEVRKHHRRGKVDA